MKWSLTLSDWKPNYLNLKRPVSFQIQSGELWRIQGENAVGKTSLLYAISKEAVSKNLRVFFLTQFKDELFNFPLQFKEILKIYNLESDQPLLEGMDLDRHWRHASGGEKTRLLLAIAFQQEVDLLILDEPEQALDEISREKLRNSLNVWQKTEDRALLYVSHQKISDSANERSLLLERRP